MPLKSKASSARQARIDGGAEQPSPETADAGSAPTEAATTPTATDKKPRAARTPNPAVAERKAADARMKAILQETKKVKADKAAAVREVEQRFDNQFRNLQSEYNVLNQQKARAVFS